ncbi:MAG: sulfatase-like hydrolase/transferase [Candidatus Aminicenantes bacterium]|nr:sulfatase-like hydrolase/transferase [Candidatus Aminicenantes bacterium]
MRFAASAKPDVLMIVVDCLRSDRVFGPGRTCRTPRIDDFSRRAVAFPRMFVENPITSPSFASFFTGCYSPAHGVSSLLGVQMNPALPTLAKILARGGYHTHAEVTGPLLPMLGIGKGFKEYIHRGQNAYASTRWGSRVLRNLRARRYESPWFLLVHLWEIHEPRRVPPAFNSAAWGASLYDRAWSALDGFIGELIDAAGPDALVVLTGDHGERVGEEIPDGTLLPYFTEKLRIPRLDHEEDTRVQEDVALYKKRGHQLHDASLRLDRITRLENGRIAPRERLAIILNLLWVALTRLRTQRFRPTPEGMREMWRLKKEDYRIGRAVWLGDSRAAQLQMLRVTLSQFHLQHGYHVYDYLTRIPFLIAGPALGTSPRLQESTVRHIDVMPTLCEILGFEVPPFPGLGTSFAPLLGTGAVEERPLYMEARGGAQAPHEFYIRGIRSGGWKLAFAPVDPEAPTELYDLRADPEERVNLARRKPDIAVRLKKEANVLAEALRSAVPGEEPSAEDQTVLAETLRSLGYL